MTNLDYFDTPKENDKLISKTLMQGDKEFSLNLNPVPWVRLFTFYNWDNIYEEVLYFYERKEEELVAISFGTTNDGGYIVTQKEFTFDDRGDKIEYQDYVYDDPWEIYKGELEESDIDSLGGVIKNIFSKKFEILYNDAMSKIK